MQYGLIGEHLPHSFSKIIHSQLAGYDYELCEIPIDPTLQSEHPSESASKIFDDLAREILKRLS